MTPSSRCLAALPKPENLRSLCVSLALLDEVLCPEWEYRLYSFDPAWSAGETMASMRNGSGDCYFIGFSEAGIFIKGFAHEAPMSPHRAGEAARLWPGMFEGVPASLWRFRDEPAFTPGDTTFCIWSAAASSGWHTGVTTFAEGPDPDGSGGLLHCLDGRAETYIEQASDYFEQAIDAEAVRHIYAHAPLTEQLVARLNPDVSFGEFEAVAASYGYGAKG